MRILIINPFGIGDVLFTTPVIRAIKDAYPDSFLGYWCNERVRPVLENNPFIDKIFALSRGDWKKIWKQSKINAIREALALRSEIRKYKFEIAIDFSLDHRYGLLARYLGIEKRIGINYKNRGRFLTDKIDIDYYRDKHVVEYYLDTLQFLNIPRPEKPKIEVFLTEQEKKWAQNFLLHYGIGSEQSIIAIAPGGGESWGKDAFYKHWPAENYKKLIKLITQNLNLKIIIFGSRPETEICNTIAHGLASQKVINTSGKLTLSQFMALVEKCRVLICNDGGPIHVAVGLEVRTVSIFGPVDEKVYGPYPEDGHTIIKKDLPCRPCYKNFRFPGCNNNHKCLKDISVEEVYSAVEKLLVKKP
jgi:heptosyltransferase-2